MRFRSPRRMAGAALAAALCLCLAPAPSSADTPVVAGNAELLTTLPEATGAIALEFSADAPLMVASTLKGIHTYDVSDPERPRQIGFLPMAIWQNEDMDMIERADGTKYVLVASNGAVAAAGPTGPQIVTNNRRVLVVDITDATAPALISSVSTPTRTHTVSCVSRTCEYAYTDGRSQGEISIVDLRNPHEPKVAGTYASVVPQGHDQDVDGAGVLWHVGGQGSVALDVSDPEAPVQLNSTDGNGLASDDFQAEPWNNFIHHNSFRPNATAFDDSAGDSGEPDLDRGNVLLVTEEDYLNTGGGRCGDYEGSFQTWHVPWLDAQRYAELNPDAEPGRGTISPLDRWNTELLSSGTETPAGAFCSAHYFDYHDGGFVAQGWYQQGTRILDVRDPTDIKQVAYFFTGASETWAAYWVPNRLTRGASPGKALVYTADAVRGIDVLEVSLPTGPPEGTRASRAPVLRSWVERDASLEGRRSKDWGFLCPLAPAVG